MSVPKFQLFLGFLVEEPFHSALESINPELKEVFISEDKNYLQSINLNGSRYLGKFIGEKCDLQSLHDIEKNIYSLLTKLVPDFPVEGTPLRLFPAEARVESKAR